MPSGYKITQEEAESRIRAIHGNTYDLSKFVYVTQRIKATLICKEHGEFRADPKEIWQGTGCPECGKLKFFKPIRDWADVKEKLTEMHGDLYEYDMSSYRGVKFKIKVLCTKHNLHWEQRCMEALKGYGCPKCRYEKSAAKLVISVNEFIKRSRKAHGDKYDYSLVEQFRRQKEGVVIICPEHGKFAQIAQDHTFGAGCPKCAQENISEYLTTDWSIVLQDMIKVHGDFYGYKEGTYINQGSDIEIICPKHGSFFQTPSAHKFGQGCPICRSSKGEKQIEHYLRDLGVGFSHQKKFPELSKRYRYDFYIPSLDTIIEYNGLQHYEPIEHFGGIKSLKATQKRDKIKRQYCLDKGINYEIIRFDEDVNERIDEIIKKYA